MDIIIITHQGKQQRDKWNHDFDLNNIAFRV